MQDFGLSAISNINEPSGLQVSETKMGEVVQNQKYMCLTLHFGLACILLSIHDC